MQMVSVIRGVEPWLVRIVSAIRILCVAQWRGIRVASELPPLCVSIAVNVRLLLPSTVVRKPMVLQGAAICSARFVSVNPTPPVAVFSGMLPV